MALASSSILEQIEFKQEAVLLLRDASQAAFNADFNSEAVRALGKIRTFVLTRAEGDQIGAQEAIGRASSALQSLAQTLNTQPPPRGLEREHIELLDHQRALLAKIEKRLQEVRTLATNDAGDIAGVLANLEQYEAAVDALRKRVAQHRQNEYQADQRAIQRAAQHAINAMIWSLTLLTLLIAIAYVFTQRLVVAPINELSTAANAVATGDFQLRVPTSGKDEIGCLQIAFNKMVGDLAAQRQNLLERNTEFARTIEQLQSIQAELQISRARLRGFAAAMNTQIEAERSRIAHALHDQFGQELTALRMYLRRLQALCDNDPAAQHLIERAQEIVVGTGASMRRIVNDLRPLALDKFGLVAAAEALLKDFSDTTGVDATIVAQGPLELLDAEYKTALYRFLQECINNVDKHAQATRVEVGLEYTGQRVTMFVKDNGRGFAHDAKTAPYSHGLFGMTERAVQYDGGLSIESDVGKGTRIQVWLPIALSSPGGKDADSAFAQGSQASE